MRNHQGITLPVPWKSANKLSQLRANGAKPYHRAAHSTEPSVTASGPEAAPGTPQPGDAQEPADDDNDEALETPPPAGDNRRNG